MENIIEYFENIPSLHRSLLLVGGISFFWIIENIEPLFKYKYQKVKHASINIFFTITTILVNFPLAFLLVKTSDWAQTQNFGLLNWLPQMPVIVYTLIGLMLLDLIGAYLVHWVEHKVKWMWMFHIIHHSDLHVDTTTANRHHPGESLFRLIFTTLAVAICGAPMWMVFMYQFLSVLLSQFNHANIAIPAKLDRMLSYIIVTPEMHHVHHHYKVPYTDSNYGNIFSIWDRVFGTYQEIDRNKLVYGIDTVMDSNENTKLGPLLKLPFEKYRNPV